MTLGHVTTFVRWGLIGALAAALLPFVAATLAGHRSYTVMSGSMEPAIDTGDVVINQAIRPGEARVGDVVTFKDSSRAGELVTHRVVSRTAGEGRVAFVTRGDANTATERWSAPAEGRIGRVVVDVPRAGFVAAWLRRPAHLLLLVVLPAVGLAAFEIRSIWRPQPEPAGAGSAA